MTDLSGHSDAESRAAIDDASTRRAISIDEAARDEMHAHAAGTTSVEIGGVLIGDVDAVTGDVFVTAAIPALRATSAVASLTFTHEAWDDVNEIIARDYEGFRMVGWYHSHPRFGIFLSEYDVFIQKNFFREEWQVAYVVDPVAGISGVFGWERGEIVRYPSWNIVARGASKSVREPDRGKPARTGLATSSGPPVAVHVEDDGTPQSTAKWVGKNRLIVGGLAVFVLALITIGALLAFSSSNGNRRAAGAGARNHGTAPTYAPTGSRKGSSTAGGGATNEPQPSSGRVTVPGSDATNGLTEQWSWQATGETPGDDLFVATISLSSSARDGLYGTVRNCAPTGVTSVSPMTLATDCNLNSYGPLTPGSSDLFIFVPTGVSEGTGPIAPHYTVATGLPVSGLQASAVKQFSNQRSTPTTASSSTAPHS